jgi:hypothetical protein
LSLWVLTLGVAYLLFFWRKAAHLRQEGETSPPQRQMQ